MSEGGILSDVATNQELESNEVLFKIAGSLECPVCLQIYDCDHRDGIPKFLPCCHTICSSCVPGIQATGCPLCRAALPELLSAESLPTNLALQQLAEDLYAPLLDLQKAKERMEPLLSDNEVDKTAVLNLNPLDPALRCENQQKDRDIPGFCRRAPPLLLSLLLGIIVFVTIGCSGSSQEALAVQTLISNGVIKDAEDLNMRCHLARKGKTPLALASATGDVERVQSLLMASAKLDIADEGGVTALMEAAAAGHLSVLRLLVDQPAKYKPAKLNVQSQDGSTALLRAVDAGKLDCSRLLLQHGADVDIANHMGVTPLFKAIQKSDIDHVELLLDKDADVLSVAGDRTTLMIASEGGDVDIVKLILKHRTVSPKFIDLQTQKFMKIGFKGHLSQASALDLAAVKGHQEVVKLLLQHGAEKGDAAYFAEKDQKFGVADLINRFKATGAQHSRF